MGAAVYGHAVTSAGGFIYAASGASLPPPGGGDVTLFQRYNPVSNAWETLTTAPVPVPVAGATLAYDAAGGRLFLFGGVNSSTGFQSLVQVYNLGSGTWLPGPPMPAPRAAMAGGVIGGLIYLVGGQSSSVAIENQTWAFNPSTGTYNAALAPLPFPRARAGSAVSGGLLFVISGEETPGSQVTTNYAYSPVTNTWVTKAPIATAVNAPGATTLGAMNNCNGDILVCGGGTPFFTGTVDPADLSRAPESTNACQLYDVTLNSWSAGLPLPTARFSLRAAQAGDTLIIFGGWDGVNNVTTVDRIQGSPLPVNLQRFNVE
jgi:N-acetylneuraminic acid mutarotase